MIDIFTTDKDIVVKNKFKYFYNRKFYCILSLVFLTIAEVSCYFSFFSHDKGSAKYDIDAKVISIEQLSSEEYQVTAEYDISDYIIKPNAQHEKYSYTTNKEPQIGEYIQLEVIYQSTTGKLEVSLCHFTDTIFFSLKVLFSGLMFFLFCFFICSILREFKLFIKLFDEKVYYGTFLGIDKGISQIKIINDNKKTITLLDNPKNPIYQIIKPNEQVVISHLKGYFLIRVLDIKK